ncbi:protein DPCD [Diachasma alloeum]|uniref:protein DPCD n=1 Tax=Diachasma alloeum TaxID=454923 RepID=UPI0007381E2A|nr:protein DPCD [Diachasma alloeum]
MASEQWLNVLQKAKKTAIIQDGTRKVHFLLEDGRELVEEYNLETNVVTRRAWREKGKLGQDVGWVVEIGDPEPQKEDNLEISGIRESSSAPFVSRRITKTGLEWRIRNLPYSKEVYSITADDGALTVRTTNKKYFKKLNIPDLERVGLKPEQDRISFTHQFNTLVITYKKPPALLDLEKKILNEVMNLKASREGDVQCPTS